MTSTVPSTPTSHEKFFLKFPIAEPDASEMNRLYMQNLDASSSCDGTTSSSSTTPKDLHCCGTPIHNTRTRLGVSVSPRLTSRRRTPRRTPHRRPIRKIRIPHRRSDSMEEDIFSTMSQHFFDGTTVIPSGHQITVPSRNNTLQQEEPHANKDAFELLMMMTSSNAPSSDEPDDGFFLTAPQFSRLTTIDQTTSSKSTSKHNNIPKPCHQYHPPYLKIRNDSN